MANEGNSPAGDSSRDTEASGRDDLRKVAAYLDGSPKAIGELDGWIRREISVRYPALRSEIGDVCQTVHAKLVTNLRNGRFLGRSTLNTYVAAIAHHTAVDRIRRLYRDRAVFAEEESAVEDAAAPDNPYRSFHQLEEGHRLFEAVRRSPEACREMWRLVLVDKLSYENIALRLAIPAGTVKSRMWYCRKKMMDLLARMRGGGRTR